MTIEEPESGSLEMFNDASSIRRRTIGCCAIIIIIIFISALIVGYTSWFKPFFP